ncbi:sigma-70 family RNA polymerase sigma factor [Aeoliella sp.]|uniref:sigma-70 family RNA polymerase sigma factor n=1 Tax=Aeoliella sp. TaxID=2795800 RepID=UPI003CCBA57B
MSRSSNVTAHIEDCLRRVDEGDEAAITELVDCAYERLVSVTEAIVGKMVSVDRGLRASDVFQEAYLRLSSALRKENVQPRTVGEFMGLASRHIRFQVLDMLRSTRKNQAEQLEDPTSNAKENQAEMWLSFFEAFDALPEEERKVADLLWTWVEGKNGPAVPNMTQYEAAEVLGISRDRVKDLWRNARIKISRKCRAFGPGLE